MMLKRALDIGRLYFLGNFNFDIVLIFVLDIQLFTVYSNIPLTIVKLLFCDCYGLKNI